MTNKEYIYISYSSKDEEILNKIIEDFKSNSIDYCFIKNDKEFNLDKIINASLFLFVYTSNSNFDLDVAKEISIAISNDIPIIAYEQKENIKKNFLFDELFTLFNKDNHIEFDKNNYNFKKIHKCINLALSKKVKYPNFYFISKNIFDIHIKRYKKILNIISRCIFLYIYLSNNNLKDLDFYFNELKKIIISYGDQAYISGFNRFALHYDAHKVFEKKNNEQSKLHIYYMKENLISIIKLIEPPKPRIIDLDDYT